jgi:hypothetical protein
MMHSQRLDRVNECLQAVDWGGHSLSFKFQNMPETIQAGSSDNGSIFGGYSVSISVGASTILTEISCGFPQSLQAKVGTAP